MKESHKDAILNKKIKIGNTCCNHLKKKPIVKWQTENGYTCAIIGIRKAEGGARNKKMKNGCYANSQLIKGGKELYPLADFSNEDIETAIKTFNIDIDVAYNHFNRTGC
jgi:3'-phosphoadenosine 5'-phosphosulfate sulfotransferase (PAPS reductase)/FAD synthetase